MTLGGLLLAGLAGGCSKGPAPAKDPAAATDTVAVTLFLDADRRACVQARFDADPSLAAALNPGPDDLPTSGQLDAFASKLRECIPADVLADAAGRIILSALPRAGDADLRCVKDRIVAMSPKDQDTLLIGSVNPPPVQLDLARLLTDQLTVPCNLNELLDPAGDTDIAPPLGPVPDTVPGGGSGATVITR